MDPRVYAESPLPKSAKYLPIDNDCGLIRKMRQQNENKTRVVN